MGQLGQRYLSSEVVANVIVEKSGGSPFVALGGSSLMTRKDRYQVLRDLPGHGDKAEFTSTHDGICNAVKALMERAGHRVRVYLDD